MGMDSRGHLEEFFLPVMWVALAWTCLAVPLFGFNEELPPLSPRTQLHWTLSKRRFRRRPDLRLEYQSSWYFRWLRSHLQKNHWYCRGSPPCDFGDEFYILSLSE